MKVNVAYRWLWVLFLASVSAAATAAITTEIIGTWSGSCVSYARYRVPSLPYGLNTLEDKKRIINSYTCRAGSVAVIDAARPYGHLAVVESCDSDGSMQGIKITEANWKAGYITRRSSRVAGSIKLAQSELRILGYFRP